MTTKQERVELFRDFQTKIKHADTYTDGIDALMKLRACFREMYEEIFSLCEKSDFSALPLKTDDTIAFDLYHLQRIEDITSNTLIAGTEQIFFSGGYDMSLCSPIITTANELPWEKLPEFSEKLELDVLRDYVLAVHDNTNRIILQTDYAASCIKITPERKKELLALGVVSEEGCAFWLVDYWCKKTATGLMLMPFSRHQMMHLDDCCRIMKKLHRI